jgi:hypothetical protein
VVGGVVDELSHLVEAQLQQKQRQHGTQVISKLFEGQLVPLEVCR